MMRAIRNPFLSMQRGWIPKLDQVYNPHEYCKTTLINVYINFTFQFLSKSVGHPASFWTLELYIMHLPKIYIIIHY